MNLLPGSLLWPRLFLTVLNPLDSPPAFVLSSIKVNTKEDILIYIAVSLVGIVTAGMTFLVIYLLSIMLTK